MMRLFKTLLAFAGLFVVAVIAGAYTAKLYGALFRGQVPVHERDVYPDMAIVFVVATSAIAVGLAWALRRWARRTAVHPRR